ncbi:putative HNHc nuclease [Mycoplasma sp. P36-A1]|uniref:putative HNHc nuclease n=1 Tax=Mycoplasma sp. P36-A1 TaxID=3252900 RepID=UPI003C2DE8AD
MIKKGNDVVVLGLELSSLEQLMLSENEPLKVEMYITDRIRITDSQRKCIFAICKDIEYYTGHDKEIIRKQIMLHNHIQSLSICTKDQAIRLITDLIDFVIINNIPINLKTKEYEDFNFLPYQVLMMCLKRQCVICGKPHAQIHHVDRVGIGRNRNKISHIGLQVLPLCSDHHIEVHMIGENEFKNKYHLTYTRVDNTLDKFIKSGKIQFYENDWKGAVLWIGIS